MKENENKSQNIVTGGDNEVFEKWNKNLKDYDFYVNEYIKNYKKSLHGNTASLSNYAYMKIKSEALNKELNKALDKGLLTKNQIKKILRIQLKIINMCCD